MVESWNTKSQSINNQGEERTITDTKLLNKAASYRNLKKIREIQTLFYSTLNQLRHMKLPKLKYKPQRRIDPNGREERTYRNKWRRNTNWIRNGQITEVRQQEQITMGEFAKKEFSIFKKYVQIIEWLRWHLRKNLYWSNDKCDKNY